MTTDTPIFTAYNQHAPACGQPPQVDTRTAGYHGYFQNEHGEQWIFHYDRESRRATLTGGDIGWDDPRTVDRPGEMDMETLLVALNLVLSPPEQAWLLACWTCATAFD